MNIFTQHHLGNDIVFIVFAISRAQPVQDFYFPTLQTAYHKIAELLVAQQSTAYHKIELSLAIVEDDVPPINLLTRTEYTEELIPLCVWGETDIPNVRKRLLNP
jgi:hypothetical protein